MTEKPSRQIQLLRRHKPKLITILSGQADFVLQHADSHSLVTPQGYRQIKACRTPDEKVRDLLDHIIERGPEAAQGLLELFKDQELQETFPLLDFIKSKQIDTWSSGKATQFGSCHSYVIKVWRLQNYDCFIFLLVNTEKKINQKGKNQETGKEKQNYKRFFHLKRTSATALSW